MRPLLLTALFLVAGCGAQAGTAGVASVSDTGAKPTASASPSTTADRAEQGRKFAQCMRDNGIDMPDPDPDGGGGFKALPGETIDKAKLTKAMEACKEFSPIKDRKDLNPQQIEQLRAFAACMRENGVNMPDPDPNGGLSSMADSGIKRDQPAFKKALEACNDKMGGPFGGKP